MTNQEMKDKVFDMAMENKSFEEVKSMFPDLAAYTLTKWYNYGKMARMKERNIVTY